MIIKIVIWIYNYAQIYQKTLKAQRYTKVKQTQPHGTIHQYKNRESTLGECYFH